MIKIIQICLIGILIYCAFAERIGNSDAFPSNNKKADSERPVYHPEDHFGEGFHNFTHGSMNILIRTPAGLVFPFLHPLKFGRIVVDTIKHPIYTSERTWAAIKDHVANHTIEFLG